MSELIVTPVGSELLDDPGADPRSVELSLRNIARANRWFGGTAAVRYGLRAVLGNDPPGSALTLLDLGTGAGDLPSAAVRWGRARGLRIVPLGVELSRTAARVARSRGVPTALASAGRPPIRDKSVDLVLVSQLAHHLTPDSVVQLFRAADRLARRAVIVADLRRSRLARAGFWLGARLLGFDPVTTADGLTSLRRGFTPGELRSLLSAAKVDARVISRPGSRLLAIWEPAAG